VLALRASDLETRRQRSGARLDCFVRVIDRVQHAGRTLLGGGDVTSRNIVNIFTIAGTENKPANERYANPKTARRTIRTLAAVGSRVEDLDVQRLEPALAAWDRLRSVRNRHGLGAANAQHGPLRQVSRGR
jgi:hypothetical protein